MSTKLTNLYIKVEFKMTEYKKQCHGNKIICHCKQVSVRDIRIAMVNGARTLDDIKEMTGAGSPCGKCKRLIENIIELKR